MVLEWQKVAAAPAAVSRIAVDEAEVGLGATIPQVRMKEPAPTTVCRSGNPPQVS
jgi:hypothetical protein